MFSDCIKLLKRCLLLPLVLFLAARGQAGGIGTTLNLSANSTGKQIQAALDSLPAGGEVVLAPGKYEISQPIVLRHNDETLRGSGPSTIIFLADKANCPVVILGSPLQSPRRVITHLRLADLSIDGNRKNQQVEFWHSAVDGAQLNNNGVDIWAVDEVTVAHVVCSRCRSGGLVTAETRHLTVSDFTSYDNQFDGLACYQTEESHFTGLRLHDNLCAGISLDLAFNHNTISDALLTGNELGIFMRESRNNTFKGLTISKSRKHGVFMAQSAVPTRKGWALSPGTECMGNNFDGLTVSACGGDAFLVNNVSCNHNVITGAQFSDNALGGLAEGDGKHGDTILTLVPGPKASPPILQAVMMHPVGSLAGH